MRHGQTTLNALGIVSGGADTELTRVGRCEAVEAGRRLAGQEFDFGWASPLRRSRETLAILRSAGRWESCALGIDTRLAERRLGVLERRPARSIPELASGDLWWRPPGGETYLEVALRLFDFLVDLLEDHAMADRRIMICSHVGVMRLVKGMLERDDDPARVLAHRLPNLSPLCFPATAIAIPPFLDGSVA
jgi:probable phosphoglycerate mutase